MKLGTALVCTGLVLFMVSLSGSWIIYGLTFWFVLFPCLYFGARRIKRAKKKRLEGKEVINE